MSKKSSFCADHANCVEVDLVSNSDRVIVFDDFGNRCIFTKQEWAAFVLGVKNDEFDI